MPEELEGIIDAHTHSMLSSRHQFLERKFAPALPKIEDVAIPRAG